MIDVARMRWYNTVVRNTAKASLDAAFDAEYNRRDVREFIDEEVKEQALDELFGVE